MTIAGGGRTARPATELASQPFRAGLFPWSAGDGLVEEVQLGLVELAEKLVPIEGLELVEGAGGESRFCKFVERE